MAEATRPGTGLIYLDASALVKLVVPEPESTELAAFLADHPHHVSSVVAAVEVPRATERATDDRGALARARQVVQSLDLRLLDTEVVALAGALPPRGLRALDAIHLASALSLGDALEAFVVYDRRLTEAAAHHKLPTVAPAG